MVGKRESVCGLWKLLSKTSTSQVFRQVHNFAGAQGHFRSFQNHTFVFNSEWVARVSVLQQQKLRRETPGALGAFNFEN